MDRRIAWLILVFFTILALLSVLKHEAFNSTALDLGLYDQMVWQFSHLKYDFNTIGGHYPFQTHLMLIMFVLAPLYWLGQSPIVLLVIQAAVICLGALPLYWLAKEKSGSKMLASAFAFAYLINPTVHYTALFDFHPDALGMAFFMFAFYYMQKENWKIFALFAFLGGLTKEYAPITIAILGIFAAIWKRKKLIGFAIAAAGALWLYANLSISSLGGALPRRYAIGFSWLGGSPKEILLHAITQPHLVIAHIATTEVAIYAGLILMPGLWLSILAPEILLLAAPSAALMLLKDNFQYTEIITHHGAYMLPFVFFAAVYGAERYRSIAKKLRFPAITRTSNTIAAAIIATSFIAYAAYGPFTILYGADTINPFSQQALAARELINLIPNNASISAMTWAVPHLNHREEIYVYPNPMYRINYGLEYWTSGYAGKETEYILVSVDRKDPLMNESFTKAMLNITLSDGSYGIINVKSGWVLLKKGADYKDGLCMLNGETGSKFLPDSFRQMLSSPESLSFCSS